MLLACSWWPRSAVASLKAGNLLLSARQTLLQPFHWSYCMLLLFMYMLRTSSTEA